MTKQAVDTLQESFASTVEGLVQQVSNERRFSRILAVLFIVDVLITLVSVTAVVRSLNNSRQIALTNRQSIIRSCEAVNNVNQGQLKLWGYIFTLPSTSTQSMTDEQKAQQAKNITDFKAYINKTFAPRKC